MKRFTLFMVLAALLLASCAAPATDAQTPVEDAASETENEVVEPENAGEAVAGEEEESHSEPEEEEAEEVETGKDPVVVGGTFRRPLTSEPSGLDPHGRAGSGQNVLLPYLLDTLVYRDSDNTYKPFLASDWDMSEDGTEIVFYLREDVIFHDGTPMDADSVIFTFQRFKELGAKSPVIGGIRDILEMEALDTHTLKFTFEQPSSIFFGTISMPYAGIISPTAVESLGEDFARQPVGTGPFRMAEWNAGVSITLEKNPDYAWAPPVVENQGAPNIDFAEFPILPDSNTQLTAYQADELHILFVNSPEHVSLLESDAETTLTDITLNGLIYLGFNCQKAPFDSVAVRQAFSQAVDKEELVALVLNGIGDPAFAPLAPTLPGFDPALEEYALTYDPQAVINGLEDAGYTRNENGNWTMDGEGLKVSLLTSTRPPNGDLAVVLQNQFAAVGIQVEILQLDASTAMKNATAGEYDIFLWRYGWNDADVLNIYLASDRIGRTNRQFYSNPDVDALLESGMHLMNAAEREAVYIEAQQIIMQDAPWVPLYTPRDFIAIRNSFDNVVIGAMGRVLLNDAVLVSAE